MRSGQPKLAVGLPREMAQLLCDRRCRTTLRFRSLRAGEYGVRNSSQRVRDGRTAIRLGAQPDVEPPAAIRVLHREPHDECPLLQPDRRRPREVSTPNAEDPPVDEDGSLEVGGPDRRIDPCRQHGHHDDIEGDTEGNERCRLLAYFQRSSTTKDPSLDTTSTTAQLVRAKGQHR